MTFNVGDLVELDLVKVKLLSKNGQASAMVIEDYYGSDPGYAIIIGHEKFVSNFYFQKSQEIRHESLKWFKLVGKEH